MLTLTNIQDNVPKDIWLRGRHFLLIEEFVNVKRVSPSEWVGFVCTTEKHKVTIHLNGEEVIDWQCSCSSCSENEICEHVVAILYAIQKNIYNVRSYQSPYLDICHSSKSSQTPKQIIPFIKRDIESLLETWPSDEIITFVGQYASNHPEFEAALKQEFYLITEEKDIRTKVRECFEISTAQGKPLSKYRDKQWEEVCQNLINVVAEGREMVLDNRFMDAADIGLEIAGYVADHYTDIPLQDWSGMSDFFEVFEEVEGLLIDVMVDPDTPNEVNEKIFKKLSDPELLELFVDDGIYILLMHCAFTACELTQKPEEVVAFVERIIDTLDVELTLPFILYKYVFLLRMLGRDAEAENVVKKYLDVDEVRGGEVKYQLSCGNIDKALQLMKEGAESIHPEVSTSSWEKLQLEICKDLNHTDGLINYYKRHLLEKDGDAKYLDLLKEVIPADQWISYVKDLMAEMKPQEPRQDGSLLEADLLASAEMYDELWNFLMNRTKDRLSMLFCYARFFKDDYMEKLKPMLEKEICQYASRCTGKNSYEAIGRMLRSLKNSEEWSEFGDQLAEKLKEAHPTRSSLLKILKAL